MNRLEIFSTIIEGKPSTCLVLGGKDTELPGYLLQGEKAYGYVYRDGQLRSWLWSGLTIAEGKRCIYFDPLPIFSLWDLAGKQRNAAKQVILDLCRALPLVDDAFLDLSSGIIPLWRIYGIQGGGVLLLPQSLGDLIASCADEEERTQNIATWVHHDIHPAFSLCDQMAQLLYLAVAGFPPYQDPDTREDAFRAVPLSGMQSSVPMETLRFIDQTLSLSLTKQRDIAGNGPAQKIVGTWMASRVSQLAWPDVVTTKVETPETTTFRQGQKKRADRKVFWRKKGWIVLSVVAAVTIIGGIVGSRVKQALTPPYTFGMNDVQILQEYFAGQSELNIEKMDASLAKHVKSPAELEVTNLYVNRQTRKAYEAIDAIIDARAWIADGKPAIMEGTNVYGVTNIAITQTDTDAYRVTSEIWTPYPYADEDQTEAQANHAVVYHYQQTQDFTFTTNKRDWRLITSITNVSYTFLEAEQIPLTPNTRSTAGQTVPAQ